MRSSLSDKFKYKSTFLSKANVVSLKGSNLSKASLQNLKDTLVVSEGDFEKNPDLLFLSADLYVSDNANKKVKTRMGHLCVSQVSSIEGKECLR